jgi:predicted Zn-dependent peptidase
MVSCTAASAVEYCGLAINAGSRDELPGENGLAHFVEHTIFKGTSRRRSWHIINRMESVGGELNAYTTKEETMIYSTFPAGYLDRAAELIFDLAGNSRFPDTELDKEREVVADEINSYLDQPSEAVFDDFDDIIFADSQLGHNILGTEESVAGFTSDHCRAYIDRMYAPSRMVFFYVGPAKPSAVERIVERRSSTLVARDSATARLKPILNAPFSIDRGIGSHQSHTIIGSRLPGMYDIDRQALALLTNILGGPGMNSRLNVELREKRGLVYSVDASTAMYTDAGLFTIYFGCDPDDTARCAAIVKKELNRIAETPLNERALTAAKKQLAGQTIVAGVNGEQEALAIARATLFHGHALTRREVIERVMDVSADRLLNIAAMTAGTSSLTLG